jgi:hypothetical protein
MQKLSESATIMTMHTLPVGGGPSRTGARECCRFGGDVDIAAAPARCCCTEAAMGAFRRVHAERPGRMAHRPAYDTRVNTR